ncbi:MAG: RNA methyltransferase [Bifidobacterium sp.]|jgi:tRNA/tmRNA/rRNA uracil-C5-methylase (TrmA/RlmC/RlmD family)|nr:RNA methyltransferase [Bifidobacterium sp.]
MQIEARIERFADQGRCVAHIDGRVVFVRFALPGELVRIELDEPHERKDRFWTGEVVDVREPSTLRVSPPWPLAGSSAEGGGVGGADLIHVSLPGQLAWKSATISEQMRRMGHVEINDVPVERIANDEAVQGLHWRTRVEMVADDEGRPSMRRRGTHVRVPITTMPLASHAELAVMGRHGLWNGGLEPGARIRVVVPEPRMPQSEVVQTNGGQPGSTGDEALLDAIGSNYAIQIEGVTIAGSDELRETAIIGNTQFFYHVDAAGFWQVHRMAPLVLPEYVISLARQAAAGTAAPVIWDLFSGSGLFTLPLMSCVPGVRAFSVEGSAVAVRNARKNLSDIGVQRDQCEAQVGDVAKTLKHVPRTLAHPTVVVLDPPRAGARREVCIRIAAADPSAIIYIACDPTSLARDTATLTGLGYALTSIRGFDIYPMTHHVETIALFTRVNRT